MHILHDSFNIFNKNILDINSDISISFEFFPPKSSTFEGTIFLNSIDKLNIFEPSFISITCTSKLDNHENYTYNAIKFLSNKFNTTFVPHMVYMNYNDSKIFDLSRKYWNLGIRNIVALRGDRLESDKYFNCYASELVVLLKSFACFNIFVAGYPEVHPESKNSHFDLINLKNKVDCGANKIITQFFFNIEHYLRFRDRCIAMGINVDIIPGILPIVNIQQINKFIKMTNVDVPKKIYDIFHSLQISDIDIGRMIGLIISADMVKNLYLEGVRSFHFYTLNQFEATYILCCILGLKKNN